MAMLSTLPLLILTQVPTALAAREQALRDLAYDEEGRLCFSQVMSEAHRVSEELLLEAEAGTRGFYKVNVNYDWEALDPAEGVTIWYDKDAHSLQMDPGIDKKRGVAWTKLIDNLDKTGWMELYVDATDSSAYTNDIKMYCGGYVEGMISAARISQFYSNGHQLMIKDEAGDHALLNLKKMFFNEIGFVKKRANFHGGVMSKEPEDYVDKHLRFIVFQLFGLRDGYNYIADKAGVRMLSLVDLWAINNHGILPELMFEYMPAMVYERRKYQESITLTAADVSVSLVEEFTKMSPVAQRRLRGKQNALGSLAADSQAASPKEMDAVQGPSHGRHGMSLAALRAHMDGVEAPLDPVTGKPYPAGRNATPAEVELALRDEERRVAKFGHCSALVRWTGGDILVGHATWDDFSKMTRMWKYYKFKLKGAHSATHRISMSSYPGCVSSTDNFFMLSSGLVVMDTSLEILNPKVYDRLSEFPGNSHIPMWMHVQICNRLARNAVQWTVLFGERNSGQENAQWMVVNYNLYSGGGIADNTLWIVENIPGLTMKTDMSMTLKGAGYFASYNRPSFGPIRDATGHTAAEAFYGKVYSYGAGPRAEIFGNFATTVTSLFGMRVLMRRNEYPGEGVKPNEPGHAIAARMDLDTNNLLPNGAIDAKVTNRCLFAALQCQAQSGPTHDTQPVFEWRDGSGKDIFPGWPHLGLPNKWNFDWVQMTPAKTLLRIIDKNSC